MNGITLRPAQNEDSEFVFRTKKVALGPCVTETYGWDEVEQRALHARRFRIADIQIVVLKEHPVGLLNIHREPACMHLRQLFILPKFQNCGIGTDLTRRLMEESDACGLPVALQVLKNNPRAKAFYERLGFQTVGETVTHHQMKRNPQQADRGDVG